MQWLLSDLMTLKGRIILSEYIFIIHFANGNKCTVIDLTNALSP